jgi:hypothetical protein
MHAYTHDTPVLVRAPSGAPAWVPAKVDDNLHPSERANVPAGHHCVRFGDGGRMIFPERDLQLLPEVTR